MAKLCPSAQPGMKNCKVLGARRFAGALPPPLSYGGRAEALAKAGRSRGSLPVLARFAFVRWPLASDCGVNGALDGLDNLRDRLGARVDDD